MRKNSQSKEAAMLEKRHAVMVRTLPHLELLYTLERTCVNARIAKNTSVNGIAVGQILYCVAKPVYVDRDYVMYIRKKKEKETLIPFLPRIQKCYK